MKGTILSIIEFNSGTVTPESLDSLSFALHLRDLTDYQVTGVALCAPDNAPDMGPLPQCGVDIVLLRNQLLERYSAEGHTEVLLHYAEIIKPIYLCMPHSTASTDFGGALAARLGGPCITAVNSIRPEEHPPRFTRTVAGGKLEADISPLARPAVITVSPGYAASHPLPGGTQITTTKMAVDLTLGKTLRISRTSAAAASSNLLSAEVIVAAGKGVGSIEQMELLNELASLFPRASIAGSRGACDMGLVDYGLQVGMTGKSVSPKLYIACGISGSPQHIMGMKNSGTIIAVNRDPDAPIHSVADISIVEDLRVFIPEFINAVKN